MPTDNVVPIDADVARAIARRAVRFRWFVAALAALWLGTMVPVLLFTPLPPLVPFLVLGALLVLAEHRFVLFGDETSMSGSIIVAIASVFVFADTSPFAGPMLVASLGGLYLPHVRQRDVSKFVTNAGAMSLAAVAASATSGLVSLTAAPDPKVAAASIAIATGSYWVVNNAVVSAYVASRDGTPIGPAFASLVSSDASVIAWCWLASSIVIYSRGQLALELVAIALCVGANAMTSRKPWVEKATELWERNAFGCELACWAGATIALSTVDASVAQIGVVAGAGMAYASWPRARTSFARTVGTAAITLLTIGWMNPIGDTVAGLLGIAILCCFDLRTSTVRGLCTLTGAVVLDATVARHFDGGALALFVCVGGAASLPHLLGMIHMRVRVRGISIATLVGVCVPSRTEAAVVVGGYVVLAAFAVGPRPGVIALSIWVVPIVWLNHQRSIKYRRSAAAASR